MLLKLFGVLVLNSLYIIDATLSDCPYKLEPMGCFADDRAKRTMPEQILNERDIHSHVYNGKLIDWRNYDTYLPQFICRCATAAFKKGYSVIGIQFWGECWSGPNAPKEYNKLGVADTCVDQKYRRKFNDTTKCQMATGMDSTNYVYRIAPTVCSTYYEPVGCFGDNQKNPRPMPNYISTDRDYTLPIFSGKLIDWRNWNTYSPEMICRCAALAKAKGHRLFSLQFWGECWSGDYKSGYDRDGPSTRCRGKNFEPCACNSYHCVGQAYANYVYRLINGPIVLS